MIKRITTAALSGMMVAALFGPQGALAAGEAAPAPPSAIPAAQLNGPLVPGVCLLSQAGLIDRSKIGAAAGVRLRSLAQQAQAGLDADKTSLERRETALTAERATLPPAQFQAKAQALNQRAQALQAEAAERTRQLEATRQKVFGLILQDAQPYIAKAFATHGCGLLVSREAVLGGNMTNDLTAEVVAALDANAAPLTFDLEPPAAPAGR
jgi:Skp family chaperone for outer membrane proteins